MSGSLYLLCLDTFCLSVLLESAESELDVKTGIEPNMGAESVLESWVERGLEIGVEKLLESVPDREAGRWKETRVKSSWRSWLRPPEGR